MENRIPRRGEIVEYVAYGTGDPNRAAIITGVSGAVVSLTVFWDGEVDHSPVCHKYGVKFDPDKKFGTWHWREEKPLPTAECQTPSSPAPNQTPATNPYDYTALRLTFRDRFTSGSAPCTAGCECCREAELKSILRSVEREVRQRLELGQQYIGMGPLVK